MNIGEGGDMELLSETQKNKMSTSALRREDEVVVLRLPKEQHKDKTWTLKELLETDYPDTPWLIDGLVPEGLTILSAQPGSFKTWLLLDIVISVASGEQFIDKYDTRQSNVLMIDEENSPKLLQTRLEMLGIEKELPVYFEIENLFKAEERNIDRLLKLCREKDIKLVTFDSLVRIHSSNENDAVQMSEVFSKIRKFTRNGISVMITHHNRKSSKNEGGGQAMRGSTDILAAVDCHLSLDADKDSKVLTLTQTKIRYAEELPPIEIGISSDKQSMVLTYQGEQAPQLNKRSRLKQAITDILTGESELNQLNLLEELNKTDNRTSMKTLRLVLQEMAKAEEIKVTSGKGSSLIYSLA